MARRKLLQTNFSAGELSPEIAMRVDTDQYQNGAKSLANMRCLIAGGVTRRPGSLWLTELTGTRVVKFVVNQTTRYLLAFSAGRVDFYNEDGTAAGDSLTGCPWTAVIAAEMNFAQSGNTMILVHTDMPIQTIVRTAATTWMRVAFAFGSGPAGRPEQPYLKFTAPTTTLRPTALTGAIRLQSSSPAFTPAHVGTYIRYLGKVTQVTSYNTPQEVFANVIETLPGTQELTVTTTVQFAVGEAVEGQTSGAKGVVTEIVDGTHMLVVVTPGLTEFTSENVVGPNGKTAISGVAAATHAAVEEWDEQLYGPVYGYPGSVALHRNRLIFAGSPYASDYIAASALNDLYDFNVGDGSDGDAILESIGDAGASKIVGLHSAEQLLVLTDRGPYYVPEGPSNPFRPSSMAFFPFGSPWPFNPRARPVAFDGGVIAISGSLIIKMRPTGDLSRAWEADEVSLLASHMIRSPDAIAVTSNFAGGPERYAVIRNSDNTLAVMQLVDSQKIRNFTPWSTNGKILCVEAIDDMVYMVVERRIGVGSEYVLEVLDQSLTLDAVTKYTDLSLVPSRYSTSEVNVRVDNYHLGTYPVAIDNLPLGPYEVGFRFEPQIQTLPPAVENESGPMSGQMMRIVEALISVISSARFATNGLSLMAYQTGDDFTAAPPSKEGAQRFQFMGWERDPSLTISQVDPLPLTVLSIKTEVAF